MAILEVVRPPITQSVRSRDKADKGPNQTDKRRGKMGYYCVPVSSYTNRIRTRKGRKEGKKRVQTACMPRGRTGASSSFRGLLRIGCLIDVCLKARSTTWALGHLPLKRSKCSRTSMSVRRDSFCLTRSVDRKLVSNIHTYPGRLRLFTVDREEAAAGVCEDRRSSRYA